MLKIGLVNNYCKFTSYMVNKKFKTQVKINNHYSCENCGRKGGSLFINHPDYINLDVDYWVEKFAKEEGLKISKIKLNVTPKLGIINFNKPSNYHCLCQLCFFKILKL